MVNNNRKSFCFLNINLWVWIVTIVSAVVMTLLIVFVFAPISKGARQNRPQNNPDQQQSAQGIGIEPEKGDAPTPSVSAQAEQRILLVSGTDGYTLTLEVKNGKGSWNKKFTCPAKVSENGVSTAYGEGTGKTPEGTFQVLFCIGTARPLTGLRFIDLDEKNVWVDDPYSKYYNTLQRENMPGKDWTSAENIYSYFSSGDANYAIFFNYNGDGEREHSASAGWGSVLFIFGRNDFDTAISRYGDIYISATDMEGLLLHLSSDKNPLIEISSPKVSENSTAASTKEASEEIETNTQDRAEPAIMYSTVDELMFRTGPGTEYQAIAKLNKGYQIYVIEKKDGWVHGTYGGLEGWAYGEYLTEGGPTDTNYSVYVEAIKNFDVYPLYIEKGVGCDPQYRGEDDDYVYYQVFAGGGWAYVKVPKNTNNHIPEYMTDDEIAKYGQQTQEEVVMAWVCDYTKMTAEQFYGAGGYIEYAASGTNYDYYTVAVPMAAASIVEITKSPPYTIERTGSSYAFTGPGGWGYR